MPLANNSYTGQTSEFCWTVVVQAMGTKFTRVLKLILVRWLEDERALTIGNQISEETG